MKKIETPLKPAGRGPFAIDLLQPSISDKVLNIGCFDGGLEYHRLLGKVKEFRGIDMNRDAINKASVWATSLLGSKDIFQVAAAESIPFEDSTFDKILCLDTFEHVQDERKTAAEIFRVLKPGGVLVLSVPHDFLNFLDPDELTRSMRNVVRKYIKKTPPLDHPKHRHYSEAQLRDFFKDFEFDIVHKCGTPVFWSLAMLYTAVGLPQAMVDKAAKITAPLENLDYRVGLPTGFNIMIRVRKSKG